MCRGELFLQSLVDANNVVAQFKDSEPVIGELAIEKRF
jgi:hypothetical protein